MSTHAGDRGEDLCKHSRLGIASVVLAVLCPLLLLLWVDFVTFDPADAPARDAGLGYLIALVMWGLLLIPIVLAILGLRQKQRRKLFAWIGLCIASIPLLLLLALALAWL